MYHWQLNRERGTVPRAVGNTDIVYRMVYGSFNRRMAPRHRRNENDDFEDDSINGLAFSADGSLLVGALASCGIKMWDPVSEQKITHLKKAHEKSVNCIKFINEHLFASGSDDQTVSLWDARYLHKPLSVFYGHDGWVKNIEISRHHNMLISSALDGTVIGWQMDGNMERIYDSQRLCNIPGLVRCRMTPDETRIVLTTSGGYMIVIHNLDLLHLNSDLEDFQPNVYRLLQSVRRLEMMTPYYNRWFYPSSRRNRVELITDFPQNDFAEVISSLEIHPFGWCAVSRNNPSNAYDNERQYTTVHDIQALPNDEDDEEDDERGEAEAKQLDSGGDEAIEHSRCMEQLRLLRNIYEQPNANDSDSEDSESSSACEVMLFPNVPQTTSRLNSPPASTTLPPPRTEPTSCPAPLNRESIGGLALTNLLSRPTERTEQSERLWRERVSAAFRCTHGDHDYCEDVIVSSLRDLTNGLHDATLGESERRRAGRVPVSPPARVRNELWAACVPYGEIMHLVGTESSTPRPAGRPLEPPFDGTSDPQLHRSHDPAKLYTNNRRLLYYIEELGDLPRYIKEPAFSPDGRILCSPYGDSIRLLAFDEKCSELHRTIETESNRGPAQTLHVLKEYDAGCESPVASCSFSPRMPLLVTGCRNGTLVWHSRCLH
ncbi:DDB1- and CUL4-associated factor 10 homolog [Anopheles albimanus]|uniref:DDB1- and CUL4-associated factor 10 homolog n=1 Tax=Anopheles albimanus TaxID=7167 RepID=UPI00163F3F68|nr:DDB1- and CUL4-associated factor 10 homolog [Anopheles albimanus]